MDFINADLTVEPGAATGRRVDPVEANRHIGAEGAGLATARLADQSGYFGRAVQSLVIEKR